MDSKSKNNKNKYFLALVVIVGLVSTAIWFLSKPKEVVLQGRIEASQVYLSAKIPTRVKEFLVREGATVKKGDLIASLESPEIDAKLAQAQAARAAAKAQENKAENGARAEEIVAARSLYQKASAGAVLAAKTFQRISNLYKDGVVSEQQKDEASAKKEAALRDKQAAHSQYQMAVNGARTEDKAAAMAMVRKADGAISELDVYVNERNIISPIDGEVQNFLPEKGELVPAGYPVVNLIDLADSYAVVNVKEDLLVHFKKGSVFVADIPALNLKSVKFKVYFISPLGDFATWNATKASGEFDIRTFEIRGTPLDQSTEVRPGMSILINAAQFK
ncbi:HlyD family secretion protein [Pedobacter sp. CG_S7]|uniref:HlyD family secretion protein n=1 Tax=Pedobacter sp. CG_S7 TaxID=3143930 RepID=UPI0033965281